MANDYTFPKGKDDVEACKVRVANGMQCYCLEVCTCRKCKGCSKLTENPDGCLTNCKCKTCSNCKPCGHPN